MVVGAKLKGDYRNQIPDFPKSSELSVLDIRAFNPAINES
jgi:hypothetical protein